MELVLATRNAHKAREYRELLGDAFDIKDLSDESEVVMPEETGSTFEENAILKAIWVSKSTGEIVLADDSGLEVEVLNGAPGVYSARYSGEKASDPANVEKLLRDLRKVTNRSARFRCVIALARAGKVLGTVEGTAEGTITDRPRGNSGFGYDPVFQPGGCTETFGEMMPQLKNKMSHRGEAVAALREKLRQLAG